LIEEFLADRMLRLFFLPVEREEETRLRKRTATGGSGARTAGRV
jgi:hypothetical protein